MGSVSNVGLMAKKAEEYGSHDKTFESLRRHHHRRAILDGQRERANNELVFTQGEQRGYLADVYRERCRYS